MKNVIWIGGPAGAGKSTISRLLARRYGLRRYSVDQHTWQHRERAIAAGIEMPQEGPGDYDRGPMILEDLRSLPRSPLVVAEGALVRPEMVTPSRHAVWLMPSREQQRERLQARHPEGIDPGFLQGRDLIVSQLEGTSVNRIVVDGQSVEETLAYVEQLFADLLSVGPRASTIDERRALLRHTNRVAVRHSLASVAHLDPRADLDDVIRTYDCECGAWTCSEVVDLSVSDADEALEQPPPSILARSHRSIAGLSPQDVCGLSHQREAGPAGPDHRAGRGSGA